MPWRSIQDEFGKFKWIDHAGRIYQGTPFSVEPDITSKHVFIASMMHTSSRHPVLRDTPDVTCPSDYTESEKRQEVVHHDQIPDYDVSKRRRQHANDKKSNVVIKAKSIPVTPKRSFASGEMEDYGQMATSMPDGFRVEAVDTVTTTGQWHPGRIQAQESIGDLRQLCLMGEHSTTTTNLDAPLLRLMLSLACSKATKGSSIDITSAFLNADIHDDDTVLVTPPPILVKMDIVKPNTVWHVKKAIYLGGPFGHFLFLFFSASVIMYVSLSVCVHLGVLKYLALVCLCVPNCRDMALKSGLQGVNVNTSKRNNGASETKPNKKAKYGEAHVGLSANWEIEREQKFDQINEQNSTLLWDMAKPHTRSLRKKGRRHFPLVWAPKLRNRKGTNISQRNGQHFPLIWTSRLRSRKGTKALPEKREAFPLFWWQNGKIAKERKFFPEKMGIWTRKFNNQVMKKRTEFPFLLIQATQGTLPGRKEKSRKLLTKFFLTLIQTPPKFLPEKWAPSFHTRMCQIEWKNHGKMDKYLPLTLIKILSNPQKVSEKNGKHFPLLFTQKCLRWNDEKILEKWHNLPLILIQTQRSQIS